MTHNADIDALTEVIREWLDNGYDDSDDTGYQASVLAERIVKARVIPPEKPQEAP